MGKNNKSGNGKFAISAIVAGVAGYVTGVLTAPKSGRETRKDVKDAAQKSIKETEKQLKTAQLELSDALDNAKKHADTLSGKAKEQVNSAIDAGKQAKQKGREMLTAIHEGDAEDKELKAAIDEAQKSIENLKSYIKIDKKDK